MQKDECINSEKHGMIGTAVDGGFNNQREGAQSPLQQRLFFFKIISRNEASITFEKYLQEDT